MYEHVCLFYYFLMNMNLFAPQMSLSIFVTCPGCVFCRSIGVILVNDYFSFYVFSDVLCRVLTYIFVLCTCLRHDANETSTVPIRLCFSLNKIQRVWSQFWQVFAVVFLSETNAMIVSSPKLECISSLGNWYVVFSRELFFRRKKNNCIFLYGFFQKLYLLRRIIEQETTTATSSSGEVIVPNYQLNCVLPAFPNYRNYSLHCYLCLFKLILSFVGKPRAIGGPHPKITLWLVPNSME